MVGGGGGNGHFGAAQAQADALGPDHPPRWTWRNWLAVAVGLVPLIAVVVAGLLL